MYTGKLPPRSYILIAAPKLNYGGSRYLELGTSTINNEKVDMFAINAASALEIPAVMNQLDADIRSNIEGAAEVARRGAVVDVSYLFGVSHQVADICKKLNMPGCQDELPGLLQEALGPVIQVPTNLFPDSGNSIYLKTAFTQ